MSTKKKLVGAALAAATVGAGLVATTSVNADPKQYNAFVGLGSDTTQDVVNALAGEANGNLFDPVQSSEATGERQLISFNATPPPGVADTCVTTKIGGPTFDRPNGSSAGRRALSRAVDGGLFGDTGLCSPAPVDVSGQVDFARSSSGPSSGDTGTDLTYIPLGRDGVSFAYARASGGAPVTELTRSELTSLFTTGPQTIDGVRIVPCGIQTGSGTFEFWNRVTTATDAQEDAATAECNGYVAEGRAQENDAVDLQDRADAAPAGDQVIIGFSAGAFIAKSNLVADPTPPATVGIGSINDNGAGADIGNPVTGTAPDLTPVASFFNDGTFGRTVYNVLPTVVIDSAFGNLDIKSLFKDEDPGPANTATLCAATDTIETFGFLATSDCGDTTLKGSFRSGQNP